MAKILLVEDDRELGCIISACLSFDHFTVEHVENGSEAVARLRTYQYDLVILDWGLPGMSGLNVCQNFRAAGGTTPILMLTARGDIVEKEQGLDSGADDYLTKPFDKRELTARIRALLRRAGDKLAANALSFDDLTLEPNNFRVTRAGVEVNLVAKEFALLELFMRHPGRLFSPEALISQVWMSDEASSPESIRQHIKNLRKKLDAKRGASVIQTVRGVGYKLDTRNSHD
jgi:DNA-binding response OmpR family regulator